MAAHLIFGGTGGIGEALARRLATSGERVHLAGRSEAKLSALAREIGNAGFTVCDVTKPADLEQAVAEAARDGGLSGLAYAVGSIDIKPLRAVSPEDLHRAFDLNLVGAAMAVRHAQKALTGAKGAVVLFSTVAVAQGFANHAITAAVKGAVEGMARSLAAELAPAVRVNVVAPSLTRTPLAEPLTRNATIAQAVAELHALQRLGEADDPAAAAAFLLSADAGWITGQVIGVDGGRARLRTKG